MKNTWVLVFGLFAALVSFADCKPETVWTAVSKEVVNKYLTINSDAEVKLASIQPNHQFWTLNYLCFTSLIWDAPERGLGTKGTEITMALADGTLERFEVFRGYVSTPEAEARWGVRNFEGSSLDTKGTGVSITLSLKSQKIAGMILPFGGMKILVDPYLTDSAVYVSQTKAPK